MASAPDWPKVLSLAVHEFRTPLTVVAGYLRMLSTDRVGPMTEAQQRVVQEAERSCERLSALLVELSDVAHFHQGRITLLRGPVSLARILDTIRIPEQPERSTDLVVGTGAGDATVEGDATRLGAAFSAIAAAIARESVDGQRLHVLPEIRDADGGPEAFIAIGAEDLCRQLLQTPLDALPAFDTTRGGSGLSLIVARHILEEHGARLFGASGARPKSGAAIALPLSSL